MKTTIGTRGSRLALVQAHATADALGKLGMDPEIRIIKTKGDVVQDRFDKMEGKGFFTKEIEDALLHGDIDLAVHCLKDLPTSMTPGLAVGAIPEREDPHDVLISAKPLTFLEGQPQLNGLRVGTSSNRRVAGLRSYSPLAEFLPIRGNVPRRVEKMASGEVDVVVLAQAGLNRLGLSLDGLHAYRLSPEHLVPAPGQGALALQVREGSTLDLSALHHRETARCVEGERRVLAHLDGGCQLPLGVLLQPKDDGYRLQLFLGRDLGAGGPLRMDFRGASPEALVDQALERLS